jgi:hypothetical protein
MWRTHCHIFLHHARRRRIGHTALSRHDRPTRHGRYARRAFSSRSTVRLNNTYATSTTDLFVSTRVTHVFNRLRLSTHASSLYCIIFNIIITLSCSIYILCRRTKDVVFLLLLFTIYILTPFLFNLYGTRIVHRNLICLHPRHRQTYIDNK